MGVPVKVWDGNGSVPMEPGVINQAYNIASLPFVFKHVALMSDAHQGIGGPVGAVVATQGAVIPAVVGVDLSCGMVAQRLNLSASDLPDNLDSMRMAIEDKIPTGVPTRHSGAQHRGRWKEIPERSKDFYARLLASGWRELIEKHPKIGDRNGLDQLGTLGSGNHFIEICLDQTGRVWIMLHSGSRGVGNRIGNYFINIAKEDMRRHFINLPDYNLAYLSEGTQHFNDYITALEWAAMYAKINRIIMVERVMQAMRDVMKRSITYSLMEPAVHCHHNYLVAEDHFNERMWVTRKGAVRAGIEEYSILPGSMGARSYIVQGKGNPDSFMSCSHGAGRAMSRSQAKKQFTLNDHIKATEGVACRKDAGVLDETPAAYKDIDAVMAAQRDLCRPIFTLRQVVNVKG
jgi:tRNA-splicing ligase RtcB (3'-phosphate/5'-hydroxy nucleic acid ligase)